MLSVFPVILINPLQIRIKMKAHNIYILLQRLADHTIPKEFRQTFREWLVDGQDQEEKEAAVNRIWEETSGEPTGTVGDSLQMTWQKIRTVEKRSAHRLYIQKWIRYAAILLLPLITGIVVWKLSHEEYSVPEMVECYVPYGEQQMVILSDGSQIRLNAGSLLIYPSRFTANKRQVYLSGEANFAVESDPEKPFVVRTGSLNVEAVGTKFNIESYPGSGMITTTLEQGAVKIYKEKNPDNSILMKPDEQVCYLSHEDRFITSLVESSDYAAWTNGELRFINKTLGEILFTLERKYDVRFLVDTGIKGTDLYNIKFRSHETIEDALYILGEIVGTITYKQEGQTIRLNLKGKEVAR